MNKNGNVSTGSGAIIKHLRELGVPVEVKKINAYSSKNYSRVLSSKRKKRAIIG
ncbi:hypothetical protein [Schinkia azotoformans]|uniref:hypothetical protein n=1 Tax=Schinkia azotoformans TaxID=1454 RepID=UPI002DBC086F|nr:hypothetical protein [Schinkia azotoformans]MEC1788635.1 hypothetical protein [Schinkia azotoformans]MED4419954.1 hypothetical protein [Schinkia azotoformans]